MTPELIVKARRNPAQLPQSFVREARPATDSPRWRPRRWGVLTLQGNVIVAARPYSHHRLTSTSPRDHGAPLPELDWMANCAQQVGSVGRIEAKDRLEFVAGGPPFPKFR